ncbi:hypothetical protein [Hymenobacter sp. CRA2]|uniref:hypothetical protein n=1 Tax=Hymenobacter sp. CRA2 TaxID=1955620 RepID=UPI00098EC9B5|nr:hypothetical protein [Hymenobacter sp. CRA2]OON65661.1 hypothetical protein B0919_23575 [Hymenobacter sp. CRA2]
MDWHHEHSLGWGTLALVNAALAQGKGRSGVSWFILSLLLGPIATLLLILSRPRPVDGIR